MSERCSEEGHDFYSPVVTVVEVEKRGFFWKHRRQWAYCFMACRFCGEMRASWTKWDDDGKENYYEV
jgi:hypothetical protein